MLQRSWDIDFPWVGHIDYLETVCVELARGLVSEFEGLLDVGMWLHEYL